MSFRSPQPIGISEFEVLNPPRTLCRSCEQLPYPFPNVKNWCCRAGLRPKPDGSCGAYERVPGSDDE
jgi:hypothetical protein